MEKLNFTEAEIDRTEGTCEMCGAETAIAPFGVGFQRICINCARNNRAVAIDSTAKLYKHAVMIGSLQAMEWLLDSISFTLQPSDEELKVDQSFSARYEEMQKEAVTQNLLSLLLQSNNKKHGNS